MRGWIGDASDVAASAAAVVRKPRCIDHVMRLPSRTAALTAWQSSSNHCQTLSAGPNDSDSTARLAESGISPWPACKWRGARAHCSLHRALIPDFLYGGELCARIEPPV